MARRSKPTYGFPSKPLIGVQAERVQEIMLLMASGQWSGKISEILLARKWNLSLAYVQDLASQASANLQITLTPEFQDQLRARLYHATQALTAKLSEYVLDDERHGEHDRYEASADNGQTWFEIPRKAALDEDYRASVKIRRVPCAPVGSLPSLAQAAFKGMEAIERLAMSMPVPGGGSGGGGSDGGTGRPEIKIVYELPDPGPKAGDGAPPAAPAAPG